MVQRDQWDTYWGSKKEIFLIRDIDDATGEGASMESCRFVVLRSPRGRLRAVPSGRREGMFPGRYSKIFGLGERLGCILNLGHSFDAIEAYLWIC